MALTLYMHPLSSFCWKALIAFYESGTPFTAQIVNLTDEKERAAFAKIWPLAKFPVLRDDNNERTIPESTTIIEYLAQHYPGSSELVPNDADRARQTRFSDRFFDLYIHLPMQKIVGDKLRPAGTKDPLGVEEARARIRESYALLEQQSRSDAWAMGDTFTLADCAAAPALYYGNRVEPLGDTHPKLTAYLQRLEERPSFARVLQEAAPYFKFFPG